MKIKYSPQVGIEKIKYVFEGDKITATIGGVTDIFDFIGFSDGVAESIETILPINPIVSAERVKGVLYSEILQFVGTDAEEEELYPEWQEVK